MKLLIDEMHVGVLVDILNCGANRILIIIILISRNNMYTNVLSVIVQSAVIFEITYNSVNYLYFVFYICLSKTILKFKNLFL